MTRFFHARRARRLAPVLLAIVSAACGDGLVLPRSVAGYYRLATVNGQPLPYSSPPSIGLGIHVTRGDLVLRPNGTFIHGLGGTLAAGFVVEGRYRLSDRELVLEMTGAAPGDSPVAHLSGDSIVIVESGLIAQPLTFTYRRAQPAPNVLPADRLRLRSINGRSDEPLVAFDTTIGNRRDVMYVHFDSIAFGDGVFFRRHRSQSAISYVDGDPAIVESEEWTRWGAYDSAPGWVVLAYYSAPFSTSPRDSLSIAGDTLVRRTPLITGVLEERYTRP